MDVRITDCYGKMGPTSQLRKWHVTAQGATCMSSQWSHRQDYAYGLHIKASPSLKNRVLHPFPLRRPKPLIPIPDQIDRSQCLSHILPCRQLRVNQTIILQTTPNISRLLTLPCPSQLRPSRRHILHLDLRRPHNRRLIDILFS